ncbi:MAG: hypothetical protein IPJ74_01970 [Saprospiraceae bacterium]|nr:hypothetical protein [Saprospiraceae bacterium]
MQTIELPLAEYERMQEELSLLKDAELLQKVNRLIDLLYQDKYGLYMGDFTEDLTEAAVNEAWEDKESSWDHV